METNSTLNKKSNMRTQVARSKGTEWMVSSYNAWQSRLPMDDMPKRNSASFMHVVSRMPQQDSQIKTVLAFSFKSILIIVALILSIKNL